MITSIKLFYSDVQPMVALYGSATEHSDGWQCNVPVHEVVQGDFSALPVETQISMADAVKMVDFIPEFQARSSPPKPVLTLSAMVSEITADTNLSEEAVRQIVLSMLRKLRQTVLRGDTFSSESLLIRPRPTAPATPDPSGPATGHRRLAVVLPLDEATGATT
jgi:hypothetical protein